MPGDSFPELLATLQRLPLFADVEPDLIALVAKRARRRSASRGEVICRAGAPGDEFYVVLRGAVRITVPGMHGEQTVNELGAGEWFGEMALITGEPRSATAVASRDTVLLVLSRAEFHDLLARVPRLALSLGQALSRRFRAHLLRREPARAPALIVAVTTPPAAGSANLLANLAVALAGASDTPLAVLDRASTDARLVPGIVHLAATEADPAALCAAHPLVLVRVSSDDPVAATFIAEADTVLALDGDDARAPASAWVRMHGSTAPVLTIRCGPSARGESTVTLDPCLLASPGVVTASRGDGASRALRALARRVLRRRAGLALGAGGAKGLAHVGALRVFEREGLEFDMIAGTSIGGIVGALLAIGRDSEDILAVLRRVAGNLWQALLDFGLPEVALLRGARKRAVIREQVGERTIDDLPIPFWAIAGDLVSGKEFVMGSGPLWRALDATSAIPVIFPPVVVGQRMLVDGWVSNPLPADVLHREGADAVIAVDVSGGVDMTMRVESDGSPGLLGWVQGLGERFANPAIVKIALRALDVGGRERTLANLALADAAVQPDLAAFGMTDVRHLDEIVERGVVAAEEALPTIRAAMRSGARRPEPERPPTSDDAH